MKESAQEQATSVIILEDGKAARGQKAKLIKRGKKRVLIEFYDDWNEHKTIRVWFKLFTKWGSEKHNNKRKSASYHHEDTNMFYSDCWQTERWKSEAKEYFTPKYYQSLFGLE